MIPNSCRPLEEVGTEFQAWIQRGMDGSGLCFMRHTALSHCLKQLMGLWDAWVAQ